MAKFGDELNKGKKTIQDINKETAFLIDSLTSLGATISEAIASALDEAQGLDQVSEKIAKTYSRDIVNGLKKVTTGLDKQLELQLKINKGQDVSKEIEKEKIRRQAVVQSIQTRINLLAAEDVKLKEELVANLNDELSKSNAVIKILEKQNEEREKSLGLSNKLLGGLDGFFKTIDKSGNLSKIFNFEKTNQDFLFLNKRNKKFQETTGKNVPLSRNLRDYSKSLLGNIDKSALRAGALAAAAKLTLNTAKALDTRLTTIRKEFGLSRGEAGKLNFELTNTFGDLAANVENILKANKALNQTLGDTGVLFNEEIRESAASTLYRLKLSEEAVGNLGKLALASGKSFAETELSQARGALSAEKEFGIRLNLRNILEESNKITGALRINTERLPGGLAKAVSVAKSLGAEFKTIADAAGQLLDFESSIEKELQAELLIGRDLNLERARLLALNGDIEGVTRELVAQAGSLEELQSMNVIQQNALAGALGISSDQLSDILLNQKSLNAVAQEGLDRDAERVLEQEKALSVQESLNLILTKFNDILKISLALLAGIAAALTVVTFGGAAAAGAAAGVGLTAAAITGGVQYLASGGMVTGPTRAVIGEAGPEAVIPLNDNTPLIKQANETNKLLREIVSKQGTVKIDSTRAGTAFSMGTYQVQ